ncbi:hypothetical protein BJ508DRAFT_312404 [Ascobolus immersus RN42]|uniref:Uncharacterized protein n=1 Tax=Ascobolus immersus RN42 TaxID=1160509 RepID=A0A3N4HPT7_ASCIM|nr:hypothetical protein BJ508DRAFT_312404 [Ascobolus immersus RN42]
MREAASPTRSASPNTEIGNDQGIHRANSLPKNLFLAAVKLAKGGIYNPVHPCSVVNSPSPTAESNQGEGAERDSETARSIAAADIPRPLEEHGFSQEQINSARRLALRLQDPEFNYWKWRDNKIEEIRCLLGESRRYAPGYPTDSAAEAQIQEAFVSFLNDLPFLTTDVLGLTHDQRAQKVLQKVEVTQLDQTDPQKCYFYTFRESLQTVEGDWKKIISSPDAKFEKLWQDNINAFPRMKMNLRFQDNATRNTSRFAFKAFNTLESLLEVSEETLDNHGSTRRPSDIVQKIFDAFLRHYNTILYGEVTRATRALISENLLFYLVSWSELVAAMEDNGKEWTGELAESQPLPAPSFNDHLRTFSCFDLPVLWDEVKDRFDDWLEDCKELERGIIERSKLIKEVYGMQELIHRFVEEAKEQGGVVGTSIQWHPRTRSPEPVSESSPVPCER